MISIFLIKTALLRFGVVISNVKFDVDGECVIVNYTMHGAQQVKSVSFSQIEQLFTSNPEAPGAYDPRDMGHDPPVEPG